MTHLTRAKLIFKNCKNLRDFYITNSSYNSIINDGVQLNLTICILKIYFEEYDSIKLFLLAHFNLPRESRG